MRLWMCRQPGVLLPALLLLSCSVAPPPRAADTGISPRTGRINAIVNAASYEGGAVAPGEIVTLFGEDLGPDEFVPLAISGDGRLSTDLAGTRIVFVAGSEAVAAPLVYVWRNQLSCVVPYAVAGMGAVSVRVERNGAPSQEYHVPVTQSWPRVFAADASGKGHGAILNSDSSRNGPDNPAMAGSIAVVYLTGEGQTNPPGNDGKLATAPYPTPALDVSATIGGRDAPVHYKGGAPGYTAGLVQLNLEVPRDVTPGPRVPLKVTVGSATSQDGITLAIAPGPSAEAQFYPLQLDFDNLSGAPDFSFLNQPITPAGRIFVCEAHFCQVGPDLLPNTPDDTRVRFFGVNLSFGGNFPSAQDAPRVARRLRRLGVNLVRLHHMDSATWARPENAEAIITTAPYPTLNPLAVSRLRGFLDALKQEGVYINLNLHVGYQFRPAVDGVPELPGAAMPDQSKPLHIFHWRMVGLQQEYARKLIDELALGDDPVLAMVEISNESSLVRSWQAGELDSVLVGEYRSTLQERWNAFLRARYSSTESLRAVWGTGGAQGPELLANTTSSWIAEVHSPSRATLTAAFENGVLVARVQVHQGGHWINIKQVGFSLDPAQTYKAVIEVRADLAAGQSRDAYWEVKEDRSPWRTLTGRTIQISSEWRKYEMVVRPPFAVQGIGRFSVDVQNLAGTTAYLRNSTLRSETVGLLPGESLEQGNIGLVDGSRAASRPQTRDYIEFLADQDRTYLSLILGVIRERAGALVPVTGTQVNWGGGPIAYDSQREMSYNDSHFYEDHYQFPRTPWDSRDWRINDSSFTGRGLQELQNTAVLRERDRPFTVSEFNQPWPNTKAAEVDPVLAAAAAFQDWDAILHYSYSHSHNYDHGQPGGFDLIFDLTKLPVIGQAAWLFRSGAVQSGREPVDVPLANDFRVDAALAGRLWDLTALFRDVLGIDPNVIFRHPLRMVRDDSGTVPERARQAPPRPIPSDTGELTYDPDQGRYLIHSRFAAAVIGRLAQGIAAGPLAVQLAESARGFAVIVLTPADGKPLEQSRRWLLSTPGYTLRSRRGATPPEPHPLVLYEGSPGYWTLAPDATGKPSGDLNEGELPVWMERVESYVTLATSAEAIRVYPLDGAGQRMAALPASEVEKVEGGFRIHLQAAGQRFSPWYEIAGQ